MRRKQPKLTQAALFTEVATGYTYTVIKRPNEWTVHFFRDGQSSHRWTCAPGDVLVTRAQAMCDHYNQDIASRNGRRKQVA